MKAFSPGHITGFFSPIYKKDPLETGSIGAGITVKKGVSVDVELSSSTKILIDDTECSFKPVENVLDLLEIEARVKIDSNLPIGCGFGVSGGATLATSLAINRIADLELDREQLVAASHVSEIKAGTGLGDVVPQSLGGVVTRTKEGTYGIGNFGSIEPEIEEIQYTVFGELDTSSILEDIDLHKKLKKSGRDSLNSLTSNPSLSNLIDTSWSFALDTELATEKIKNMVEDIREKDGKASMAMLGETVFGINSGNLLEEKTKIANEGARILE